jgi:N-formylglutamate amidohydrolase
MKPAVPLVLDSPHSGHDFPADFNAIVSEAELRESEDSYVDELYAGAHEIGAPLLAATFPRTYLDPTRHCGDLDIELIEGGLPADWPWEYRPSGKARIGKALIWRTLEDGRPIYARRLAPETVRTRIERWHTPYHRKLKTLLDETHRRFGKVYHINCHSMRAVAGRQSEEGEGSVRPDFVLGDRDGTTCEARFTERARTLLAGMGYSVKVNDPYKGVELVRAYSDPKAGRHSLQIEINKRLYMKEGSLEKGAGFSRLQKNLADLVKEIARELSD